MSGSLAMGRKAHTSRAPVHWGDWRKTSQIFPEAAWRSGAENASSFSRMSARRISFCFTERLQLWPLS